MCYFFVFRSADAEEMRAFRESVVSGHTQQIQSITSLLEKEKAHNGVLRTELDFVAKEMQAYQEQSKQLEDMEVVISSLKTKCA